MDGMTKEEIKTDPILNRFRESVAEVYGDRVEKVVLYGSRARGDAKPDSDYDIAVFFRNDFDYGKELFRLADIGTAILADTGEMVNAMPFRAGADRERSGFMHELRKDGLDL